MAGFLPSTHGVKLHIKGGVRGSALCGQKRRLGGGAGHSLIGHQSELEYSNVEFSCRYYSPWPGTALNNKGIRKQ